MLGQHRTRPFRMPLSALLAALAALAVGTGFSQGAELPAFPGAEGFGSTTRHGRGGKVVEVTNLNDSGPGSLREAVGREGPRIVVFRVGGLIRLKNPISVKRPYCMIAAQTAPGDGVCLAEAHLAVKTHDVVVRFLRSRPGDDPDGYSPADRDGLVVATRKGPSYNVVFDHCSTSWAIDENISTWYPCRDVTFQWCISSEALNRSLHPKGAHSKGLLVGHASHRISIHHNLLAHNAKRNPYLDADTSSDIVNNVIYNWGSAAVQLSNYQRKSNKPIFANFVRNYFKKGPNSQRREVLISSDIPTTSKLYLLGNVGPSRPRDVGDEWRIASQKGEYRSAEPLDAARVTSWPAQVAYEAVLAGAGAVLPRRDAVDERVVRDVRAATGRIIDKVIETPGYPEYRSGIPPRDADRDGMPDEWERARGLDPRSPADGQKDRDGDGYTNVEEYLNGLVPPHAYGPVPAAAASKREPSSPPDPEVEKENVEAHETAKLYNAARKAERGGLDDVARTLYERLIERYPGSPLAEKAAEKLKERLGR